MFFCRLWWAWLQHTSFSNLSKRIITKKQSKYKSFVTKTAYLSAEINAHMLLYLTLLVKENQLPKEALHTYLFNSQSCESMFRSARSLSGVYSTVINFTVTDFLRRSQKITIVNKIKHQQENNENESNLLFPIHYKHKNDNNSIIQENIEDIRDLDINQIVLNSYNMAVALIKPFDIIPLLKEYRIFELDSLSKYIFGHFNAKSRMVDDSMISATYSTTTSDSELDSDDDYDDDDYADNNDEIDSIFDDNQSLNESFDDDNDDENINSIKNDFNGIKIRDHINMQHKDRYFRMKINDTVKYIHKQTACWILTNENAKLSTDRLSRVMQINKK